MGRCGGSVAWILLSRLRRVGVRNLAIAFPEKGDERERILRGLYRTLGWQLVEFCQMPQYTVKNTQNFIEYDGLERIWAPKRS